MTSIPPTSAPSNGLARRDLWFWSLFGSIVVVDFITKRIAEDKLALHVAKPVVGDFLRWTLTYNTGAAMNMSLGDASRWAFAAIACVMLVVIYRMYRQTDAADRWQAMALGMIAGGALGNLIDRFRSVKGVVDFIDVGIHSSRFYVFNVADSGVTIGAILLALLLWRTPEAKNASSDAPPLV
jgi:signal peptidase II